MSTRSTHSTCYFMIVAVVLNLTQGLAQVRRPFTGEVTPQAVQKSIDLAVDALLSAQLPDDGGWPEIKQYDGGVSALVTLALINAGRSPEDPKIAKALRYLKKLTPTMTYCVALQTMVFCAADPAKFAAEIQRNTEWLVDHQSKQTGGWGYGDGGFGQGDPSNSQFALLALHEAQRAGAQLPKEKWKLSFERARKYWLDIQNNNGSFPYNPGGVDSRGSMTCAGIASLIITGSQLENGEATAAGDIRCCGQDKSTNQHIERALEWLANAFRADSNPGYGGGYHLYYLYGLERAGRMSGNRFIGEHDWYREGARVLLNLQQPVGHFRSDSGHSNDYAETALGLLFLAKGKRQNVISRLKFGPNNDWNHHSQAMQNLTSHTEQVWKRELAWQNVDLERAQLTDLLESPVLFISGSDLPTLSSDSRRLLREYVLEQGGFIFAEACNRDGCRGKEFDEYIRRFAVDVLGKPLEKLSPDHPIWHAEGSVDLKSMPDDFWLYGVQSCCRLGMVYSPISLSCRWQLNVPYGLKPDYTPAVQKELDAATLTGVNVLSYATGKELKQKLQSILVLDEIKNVAPTERGVFILPQLQHNAGADDAPRAVSNLIAWMGKENPFRVSSEHRLIPIVPQELEKYPVVFMHGRGELRLNESQRAALRDYLKNGGFLFADAICSDEQFTNTFRREMEVILGSELKALDPSHELLRGQSFSGFDIRQVTLMDTQRRQDQITANKRRVAPQLETASVEDRIAVVFSPIDLSCALESRHSLQCRGYLREDAARIGINVILFSLQQ